MKNYWAIEETLYRKSREKKYFKNIVEINAVLSHINGEICIEFVFNTFTIIADMTAMPIIKYKAVATFKKGSFKELYRFVSQFFFTKRLLIEVKSLLEEVFEDEKFCKAIELETRRSLTHD